MQSDLCLQTYEIFSNNKPKQMKLLKFHSYQQGQLSRCACEKQREVMSLYRNENIFRFIYLCQERYARWTIFFDPEAKQRTLQLSHIWGLNKTISTSFESNKPNLQSKTFRHILLLSLLSHDLSQKSLFACVRQQFALLASAKLLQTLYTFQTCFVCLFVCLVQRISFVCNS